MLFEEIPEVSVLNNDKNQKKEDPEISPPSLSFKKKIIQKPIISKFASPLASKQKFNLTPSKSFTPNLHMKLMGNNLIDLKIRSYSSLEGNQLVSEYHCDEDFVDDEKYLEKSKKPYNMMTKDELAELILKNDDLIILDCRYQFEFFGNILKLS